MLPAGNGNQLIASIASQIAYKADMSFGIRLTGNFLHAKEWLAPHNATPPNRGGLNSVQFWGQRFVYFLNLSIPEERRVGAPRARVDGKQDHSRSFPIETMNGNQVFQFVVLAQSDQ